MFQGNGYFCAFSVDMVGESVTGLFHQLQQIFSMK